MQSAFDDQDMRSGDDGTREEQPENLAQRELGALAGDIGREPFLHPIDFFIELHEFKGPLDVFVPNRLPSERDVVLDRAFEQGRMRIQHQAAARIDRVEADLDEVHVVVPHHAGRWCET